METKTPLEVRLYTPTKFKEQNGKILKGILGGMRDYFETKNIKPELKLEDWTQVESLINSSIIENAIPINCHEAYYINADKVIRELEEEKINIAHKIIRDKPHWNLIVTPEYLVSNEGGTIYGKSSTNTPEKNPQASIIISANGLNGELEKEKATILGNHYALLTEGECKDPKCLGSNMNYRKLENLAQKYKNNLTIPYCGIKHRR